MIVRTFYSAVDPDDSDEVFRIFLEDVKPAYEEAAGCRGVELLVGTHENVGGMIEGVLVSHWDDPGALQAALASRSLSEAMVRVRSLLRVEPVVGTYRVVPDDRLR